MSSPDYVSQKHQDILKELANIGVGSAVTALSTMMENQRIDMKVPVVALTSLQDVTDHFGDPESPVAATYCEADCPELGLVIVFVLPLEAARRIIARLMPDHESDNDDMERSLLMELGNIVTASYLNALSFMTGLTIHATPPKLGVDMAGAILGTVIAETKNVEDYLILLKTELEIAYDGIEGSILILPDSGSLGKFFTCLGVE